MFKFIKNSVFTDNKYINKHPKDARDFRRLSNSVGTIYDLAALTL